jgi:glycosyltransferase involved in cell wall biosynthesis
MTGAPVRSDTPIEIAHVAYTTFPADTRVKREASAAAAMGRRVAVVVLRGDGQAEEEEMGGLLVVRLRGRKSRRGPLSYLAEYIAFVWRAYRLLANDPRFARLRIVHIHTLPDFLIYAATAAQRRGARVILDLHEIFPEFAASRYPGVPGRIAAAGALWIERWARRKADVTITVNTPIDELLASRSIGRSERRVVIHNSTDPNDFGEVRDASLHPARDVLEVVYHGTLTSLYGLDVAIRGIALASERGIKIRFTILGDGPHRAALEVLVRELAVQRLVTFEPPLQQTALPQRLRACQAGIVPTRLDGMTRYSLSNKLLEYVHLGIPVLAARLPTYVQYLSENAWYWTPSDSLDLARAIGDFAAASPAERLARARRAQQQVERIAWPLERARLQALYAELLAPS